MSPELKVFREASMSARPRGLDSDIGLLLLKLKNANDNIDIIGNVNIYRNHLENIMENYPQAIKGYWYVFSPRCRRISDFGNKPNRIADCGYWIAMDDHEAEVIYSEDDTYYVKICFVYYEGKYPNGTKTDWIMEEYALEGYVDEGEHLHSFNKDVSKIDYVLCKIYKAEKKDRAGVLEIKKLLPEDVDKDWLTLGFA